jgi:hypothetical protein
VIKKHAARVADELRKRAGIEAQIVDGGHGELTVLVGDREVSRKNGENNPPVDEVLAAVRAATKEREEVRR